MQLRGSSVTQNPAAGILVRFDSMLGYDRIGPYAQQQVPALPGCHAWCTPERELKCNHTFVLTGSTRETKGRTAACKSATFTQLSPQYMRLLDTNYPLLFHDFPQLRLLRDRKAVDDWLLRQAGWMRVEQRRRGFRSGAMRARPFAESDLWGADLQSGTIPDNYGRAALLPVIHPTIAARKIGYLDVKGTGCLWARGSESDGSHTIKNGLLDLSSAVGEFLASGLLEAAFATSVGDTPAMYRRVVGSYAVIALDGIEIPGLNETAGLLVRQAALRRCAGQIALAHPKSSSRLS